MRIVGQDRDLPALPGARPNADILQHDGEQPGSDLFARRHDRIIFARIVQHGSLAAPGDEFVGLAGHRRNHDRDLMAGLHLALDVARDVADALDIGDRRAAEFHHQTGHGYLVRLENGLALGSPPHRDPSSGRRHPSAGAGIHDGATERSTLAAPRRVGREPRSEEQNLPCRWTHGRRSANIGEPAPRSGRKSRGATRHMTRLVRRWTPRMSNGSNASVRTGGIRRVPCSLSTSSILSASPGCATGWAAHFPTPEGGRRDLRKARPLAGLSVLDIGCGGGILCEPLARLGANVIGIDPAPGNIDIARRHAEAGGLAIDYRATTAEDLAATGARFDAVLAMEVIEHVTDMAGFVKTACAMVRPAANGRPAGLFFAATLNRTLKSFALAIVGAEYVLRWLPKGTHQWEKFVTPERIGAGHGSRRRRDHRPHGYRLSSAHRRMAIIRRHGDQLHGRGRAGDALILRCGCVHANRRAAPASAAGFSSSPPAASGSA